MQVFLKECAVGTESEKREETVAALKEKQKQTFLFYCLQSCSILKL